MRKINHSDFYVGLKKYISDCVFSCLSTLGCFFSEIHATKAWAGQALSVASHSMVQEFQPSCRHYAFAHSLPFADLLACSSPLSSPFFIQPNSHHPLRFISGSFLQIILQSPPGWAISLLLHLLRALDASAIYLLMMELSVSVSHIGQPPSLRVRMGPCHLHTPSPSTENRLDICLTELNSWFLLTNCLPARLSTVSISNA